MPVNNLNKKDSDYGSEKDEYKTSLDKSSSEKYDVNKIKECLLDSNQIRNNGNKMKSINGVDEKSALAYKS